MLIRGGAAALALCTTLSAAVVVPPGPDWTAASAQAAPAVTSSGYTVVADHLNNPRQITVSGGDLYVAEAGAGGSVCPVTGWCVGFTGSVTRVHRGRATRPQTGLLSLSTPNGQVLGAEAVAADADGLFAVVSGSCALAAPQVPAAVVAQAGQVVQLLGGSTVRPLGDASGPACSTAAASEVGTARVAATDPYGLAVAGGSFWVADAGAGNVVQLPAHPGDTSPTPPPAVVALSTAALAQAAQAAAGPSARGVRHRTAPTALAVGPDGALYVATMDPGGVTGADAVYRVDPGSAAVTLYAGQLSAVTGLAFDRSGTLYACEWTTGYTGDGPDADGDVVEIPWRATDHGRQVLGAGLLHYPGGVAVLDGAVYVSNWSIAGSQDGPLGPGAHGQLVRLGPPAG